MKTGYLINLSFGYWRSSAKTRTAVAMSASPIEAVYGIGRLLVERRERGNKPRSILERTLLAVCDSPNGHPDVHTE